LFLVWSALLRLDMGVCSEFRFPVDASTLARAVVGVGTPCGRHSNRAKLQKIIIPALFVWFTLVRSPVCQRSDVVSPFRVVKRSVILAHRVVCAGPLSRAPNELMQARGRAHGQELHWSIHVRSDPH
jgi:hypothetical protein